MDATLADFVRVLRGVGVRVSVAESIEAHEAVRHVGLSDRRLLKAALAMSLAKTGEERALFDGCFERFFTFQSLSESTPAREHGNDTSNEQTPPLGGGAAGAGSHGNGGEGGLAQRLLADNWPELDLDIAAAGRRAGSNKVIVFTQRGPLTRAIADDLGVRDLDREIARLDAGSEDARATALRLERARAALLDRIRDHLDRQIALFADTAYQGARRDALPHVKLTYLDRRDYAAMRELVRRMAQRLASLYGRQRKRARRGKLDLRRTLRGGLAYDGVPFDPKWRQVKKDRPKVMILCDISGSVAAVSRFLLLFLHSVADVLPSVRSFVFCSDLYEVTELFEHHPLEEAVALVLERYGERPTDYGCALRDFETACLDAVDRRTTVIVLGDARNNGGDPNLPALRRVYERARQVVWLNPEPRSRWGTGDSEMPRLATACHHVRVCNTLKDLERLVGDLMRTAV